jgi:hypothetical protein
MIRSVVDLESNKLLRCRSLCVIPRASLLTINGRGCESGFHSTKVYINVLFGTLTNAAAGVLCFRLYGECRRNVFTVRRKTCAGVWSIPARVHQPHHDAVQNVVGYRIPVAIPYFPDFDEEISPFNRTMSFATMALPDFVRICVSYQDP